MKPSLPAAKLTDSKSGAHPPALTSSAIADVVSAVLKQRTSPPQKDWDCEGFYGNLLRRCLAIDQPEEESDDMIYMVPATGKDLTVLRRGSSGRPEKGVHSYELSFFLNFIIHHVSYQLTVSVHSGAGYACKRNVSVRVFANPSASRMDVKGSATAFTYPKIFFSVADFATVFGGLTVEPGDTFVVRLTAQVRGIGSQEVKSATPDKPKLLPLSIFSGMVQCASINKAFFAALNKPDPSSTKRGKKTHFLILRGPEGRGKAQVAISLAGDEKLLELDKEAAEGDSAPQPGLGGRLLSAMGSLLRSQPETQPVQANPDAKFSALLTYVHMNWADIVELLFSQLGRQQPASSS